MKKLIRSALIVLTLASALAAPQLAAAKGGKILPREDDCVHWSEGSCKLYISCRNWAEDRTIECAWIVGGGEILWTQEYYY